MNTKVLPNSAKHVTRKSGVSDVSDILYEDPRENVRNKSCVSGPWTLENDTTHGRQTAADRRPTNR